MAQDKATLLVVNQKERQSLKAMIDRHESNIAGQGAPKKEQTLLNTPTDSNENSGGSGGSGDAVLCRVVSGSTATGYTVDIFANGKNGSTTGRGLLFVPELAANSTIAGGSWLIGHKALIASTGGND